MYCTSYTEKSIVVRGETRDHKQELKNLGGKWNGKLTDKSTQEQFGGWIFPTSKQDQVKKWLADVGGATLMSSVPQITPRGTLTSDLNIREARAQETLKLGIEKIESISKSLAELPESLEVLKDVCLQFKNLNQEHTISSRMANSDFEDEEKDGPPPKRLLGKK